MPKLIIANQLDDGFVVFLTDSGDWSNAIADAAVANDDESAEQLFSTAKQAEQANLVIDPYLIDIEIKDGKRIPCEYREYIRALGPSVAIPGTPKS